MKAISQKDILVNQKIVDRFATRLHQDQLAHAYLFVGPAGVGKIETAKFIAQLVHCAANTDFAKSRPCGQCSSCRRVESGNHPDMSMIDTSEEDSIKIAKVRELIQQTQLKPFEGRKKIFIIRNIEQMTLEGSNALLKTLEEPTTDTLLILTTVSRENVLGTVKSRCQAIYFAPVSSRQLTGQLIDPYGIEKNTSHFLGHFAQGCLGRALQLHETKFVERKNEIIDQLVLRKDNENYLKAVLGDKGRVKEALDILLYWFHDLFLLKAGVEKEYVTHMDRFHDLTKLASRYSLEQLNEIMGTIINALRLLEENLNVKISLTLLKEKIWVKS